MNQEIANYWSLLRHLGSERDSEEWRAELSKSRKRAGLMARSAKIHIISYARFPFEYLIFDMFFLSGYYITTWY